MEIENYAKSLVKHGLFPTIEKARSESKRWHKKRDRGFTEPLLCPHHPDIESAITYIENGGIIVEYNIPNGEI